MTNRPFSIFILSAVFLWLMPLGAFIKPSQEATVCGGLRAFHMCTCFKGKIDPNRVGAHGRAPLLTSSDFGQNAKSSSSGGDTDPLPLKSVYEPAFSASDFFMNSPVFSYPLVRQAVFRPPIF